MTHSRGEAIELLACEIESRPNDAPGIEIARFVRAIERTAHEVVVTFDREAADDVEKFAAAESICCSSLGWKVERTPRLRLRITATTEQLDLIEKMFANETR